MSARDQGLTAEEAERVREVARQISSALEECRGRWSADGLVVAIQSGIAGHVGALTGLLDVLPARRPDRTLRRVAVAGGLAALLSTWPLVAAIATAYWDGTAAVPPQVLLSPGQDAHCALPDPPPLPRCPRGSRLVFECVPDPEPTKTPTPDVTSRRGPPICCVDPQVFAPKASCACPCPPGIPFVCCGSSPPCPATVRLWDEDEDLP